MYHANRSPSPARTKPERNISPESFTTTPCSRSFSLASSRRESNAGSLHIITMPARNIGTNNTPISNHPFTYASVPAGKKSATPTKTTPAKSLTIADTKSFPVIPSLLSYVKKHFYDHTSANALHLPFCFIISQAQRKSNLFPFPQVSKYFFALSLLQMLFLPPRTACSFAHFFYVIPALQRFKPLFRDRVITVKRPRKTARNGGNRIGIIPEIYGF